MNIRPTAWNLRTLEIAVSSDARVEHVQTFLSKCKRIQQLCVKTAFNHRSQPDKEQALNRFLAGFRARRGVDATGLEKLKLDNLVYLTWIRVPETLRILEVHMRPSNNADDNKTLLARFLASPTLTTLIQRSCVYYEGHLPRALSWMDAECTHVTHLTLKSDGPAFAVLPSGLPSLRYLCVEGPDSDHTVNVLALDNPSWLRNISHLEIKCPAFDRQRVRIPPRIRNLGLRAGMRALEELTERTHPSPDYPMDSFPRLFPALQQADITCPYLLTVMKDLVPMEGGWRNKDGMGAVVYFAKSQDQRSFPQAASRSFAFRISSDPEAWGAWKRMKVAVCTDEPQSPGAVDVLEDMLGLSEWNAPVTTSLSIDLKSPEAGARVALFRTTDSTPAPNAGPEAVVVVWIIDSKGPCVDVLRSADFPAAREVHLSLNSRCDAATKAATAEFVSRHRERGSVVMICASDSPYATPEAQRICLLPDTNGRIEMYPKVGAADALAPEERLLQKHVVRHGSRFHGSAGMVLRLAAAPRDQPPPCRTHKGSEGTVTSWARVWLPSACRCGSVWLVAHAY
eukprot:Polyplicarium_translucidae@DN692_c0_g1_i2.p1